MRKLLSAVLATAILLTSLTACSAPKAPTQQSSTSSQTSETTSSQASQSSSAESSVTATGKEIKGLTFEKTMELKYAEKFSVDYYNDGYKFITILDREGNKQEVLVIPEGKEVPEGLDKEVIAIKQPLNNLLISSTPTTSLINSLGELDRIKLTTTEEKDWYIDDVKSALQNKKLAFIGSYKEPDYEQIIANQPQFAVFSTMLLSVPEVAEKLKELKVPYILDQASYEPHPMARVEWIKLYGALFNTEDKANEKFEEQCKYVESIKPNESKKETVAIFHITSKGVLHERKAGDYVVKMVEMAGGEYIFKDLEPDSTGTVKMEFEDFYKTAKDADRIIYMWSLGGKPANIADFTAKNELFKDFKAVKENNVWCTTPDFFQISDTMGYMINDINKMLQIEDGNDSQLKYLFRLK